MEKEEYSERLNQLRERMEVLFKRSENLSKELNDLREEIIVLQNRQAGEPESKKKEAKIPVADKMADAGEIQKSINLTKPMPAEKLPSDSSKYASVKTYPSVNKSFTEKFVGENLINKVGIIITIIGVVIGAKYTIEHQLISPLTRIVSGYLIGLGLLGFGIKLKKNYENYSAVLISGSMAILYFITYAAFSFYNLIPQTLTFLLMVIITVFTVMTAFNFNKQVIALIGLVGAYAVPFLVGRDSGRVDILFRYIAIINIGVLLIAHKKYWKLLYYSSFIFTWLIFLSWYDKSYLMEKHFGLGLSYLTVYFVTFYLIFLDYKLFQKEKFDAGDIVFLLANSFIFFGAGYSILSTNVTARHFLGLFTLSNAVIHFGVSMLINRQKLVDRNLFYLVTGLVLTFITITIPIQLSGNWVTLLWACEAALLFWIGRTQKVLFYEMLAYILMFLTFISLIHDWITLYNYNPEQPKATLTPIFNINFLTSLFCIASFGFINYLKNKREGITYLLKSKELKSVINFSVPAVLIITIYYSFRMEISSFLNQSNIDYRDLIRYRSIWLINYSLLFVSLLSFVNIKKIRNRTLGLITIALIIFLMLIFLTIGLYTLSELRESYLNQAQTEYFYRGPFNIWIRYISFVFAGLMLISLYQAVHQEFMRPVLMNLKVWFDLVLFISILWIASSELINWMDILKFQQSYKLGLSILWGIYSLILIILGIWQRKKHLRIGAIVLFGFTLLKLFYYDISYLDTIAKTIVFVSLGILLLIISFLYNKYRHLIFEESES